MKRSFNLYTLLFSMLCGLSIFQITGCQPNEKKLQQYISEQNPMDIPDLIERKGALANATEWTKTKEKVAELKGKIAKKPEDTKLRLQAATIFITEQRITGEHQDRKSVV